MLTAARSAHCLSAGSRDTTIKLWDPVTAAAVLTLEGHAYQVNPQPLQQCCSCRSLVARILLMSKNAAGNCLAA